MANFGKAYQEKKKESEQENIKSELSSYSKMDKMLGNKDIQPKKKVVKKVSHKVFSFWALREDIARWQAYYKAIGKFKVFEDMGKLAIDEYIANHPLPEANKAVYDFHLEQELAEMKIEKEQAERKYCR